MNTLSKQKWILAVLVLLLATNIATLVYLWLPAKRPKAGNIEPGGAFQVMVSELKMTPEQQATYRQLKEEHQEQLRPYREQIRAAKDGLFSLLGKDNVSEATIEAAALKPTAIQQQIDLVTFRHFKKLRAICTPQQQLKFDSIIQDVIHQMGPGSNQPVRGAHPEEPRFRPPGDSVRRREGPPEDRMYGPPPPRDSLHRRPPPRLDSLGRPLHPPGRFPHRQPGPPSEAEGS